MSRESEIQNETAKLKILAFKPQLTVQTIKLNRFIRCEPLELEYLYTVLQNHDIHLLDGITDRRNPVRLAKRLRVQVVLVTSLITNITSVLDTSKRLKALNPPPYIFVGGPDAEVMPEHYFSEYIDGVFFADQLDAIVEVVKRIVAGEKFDDVPGGAFKINGEFCKNPSKLLDPEKLPRANHYLLHKYPERYKIIHYAPCAAIKTSFGCADKCTFCFCREMNGGVYRARPMEDVIAEIEEIRVKNIIVLDDNFLAGRKRVIEFCRMIEEKGIEKEFLIIAGARFIANNPGVMHRLRAAGVTGVMVGLEFVTDNWLLAYDKNTSMDDNNKTIEICREADIDLYALFIVNPGWKHSDFRELARYIRKSYMPFALFSTLTIFPGTKLAETITTQDDPRRWWRYDLLRLHTKPAHMSAFMFYLWVFYLYMIPGMKFITLKKFFRKYGIWGIVKHALTSFFIGLEYLVKLAFWK